jgi:hypothetical protein
LSLCLITQVPQYEDVFGSGSIAPPLTSALAGGEWSASRTDSQSQSYVTTDGQPASLSWNKAPIWGLRPDCLTVAGLMIWGALSDERTGLPFAIATGPRQRSHFRVRVPQDSWPYFTVSDSRLPFSSPPTTRRVTVEVFDPAFTRVRHRQLHPRGNSPRYRLDRRLGGPHSRSGSYGQEKNLLPLLGIEPWLSRSVARCYTDWAPKRSHNFSKFLYRTGERSRLLFIINRSEIPKHYNGSGRYDHIQEVSGSTPGTAFFRGHSPLGDN